MPRPITILCVPGVGYPAVEDRWFEGIWKPKITEFLESDGYDSGFELVPFKYRSEFRGDSITPNGYASALADLGFGTGNATFGRLFRRGGGMDPFAESLKWRAATIAHWAENRDLRESLAEKLKTLILERKPDVVLAHALGSLIAYDALRTLSRRFLKTRSLISFGSQLGNPYIRNQYAGRIEGLRVKQWYHLYNVHDRVFTSPLHLQDRNFALVNVTFDNPDPLDHTALSTGKESIGYLDHYTTRQLVWPNVVRDETPNRFLKSVRRATRSEAAFETADHRALLIGIDEYESPAIANLDGCVNDTYLMSEALQSVGFPAENIRMLHNRRATKDAIIDRMDWLLDDLEEGDVSEFRFLHFSGHGAQIASYGVGEVADRLDECLCPHDFDWSIEKAIVDDLICAVYSQLPYDAHFVMVLDCCHSGGLARNGQSVRGLSAPRDVAHRAIYFESGQDETPHGMWRSKSNDFVINRDFFRKGEDDRVRALWMGARGATRRIGRSPSLRMMDHETFTQRSKALKHKGPYLPTIFQACSEDEPALEHVQGSTPFGAFTFSIGQALAAMLRQHETLSYAKIQERAVKVLSELGYSQKPQLLMPKARARLDVPSFTTKS